MSYNFNKPMQLTIADSKLEAIITSVQTESNVETTTLLHMNEQTNINLQIECELIKPHIALTREDLKNIKIQLESYGMSGMDEQIKVLTKELFLPRTNFMPKELVNILRPTRGVILYGPPGTGKTTLARNIGNLLHIPSEDIKMITATEILNKFIGASEENIRGLFEPAKKNPNKVHLLIIDEMDAILGSRKDQTELRNSIVNQFLGEMDGLNQISNILIIGITNRLDMLDSAVLRPGRFSCLIKCDLPNIHSRKQIIQLYINKLQVAEIKMDDFLLDEIAEKTDGFSCADIEYIFNCLIDKLAQHLFDTEGCVLHITRQDMLEVIEQIKCRR
jgi:vesicle-fusing ATPase